MLGQRQATHNLSFLGTSQDPLQYRVGEVLAEHSKEGSLAAKVALKKVLEEAGPRDNSEQLADCQDRGLVFRRSRYLFQTSYLTPAAAAALFLLTSISSMPSLIESLR